MCNDSLILSTIKKLITIYANMCRYQEELEFAVNIWQSADSLNRTITISRICGQRQTANSDINDTTNKY